MRCILKATIHFRVRSYDCYRYDELLWEQTDRDVAIDRLIVSCWFYNVLYFHLILSSVQFDSVQDGIYALGKAHMLSTPSLRRFPNVAFETVQMFV